LDVQFATELPARKKENMRFTDFRAIFLPYCLERQPEGGYAVLNRDYKPIGFLTDKWIEYDKYPVLVQLNGIGRAKAAKLCCKGNGDKERIYLYSDDSNPVRSEANMQAYLARLKTLAKVKIETDYRDED
jgi:hypothetical protein